MPLNNILRHLALESTNREPLFPNTWKELQVISPIRVETEPHLQANANYQLQHHAYAVFDLLSKKWRIEAEGDLTAAKILGVIASKKHGARAIQLPNHTHKIIAGIIDAELLMNLFASPVMSSDMREITLNPIENGTLPFIAIVPMQNRSRTISEPKSTVKSQYKHL